MMKVGDTVWLVSYGMVIRRYTQGTVDRITPKQVIVRRVDRNGTQRFARDTGNSIPYDMQYRIQAERPEDSNIMRPSAGQVRFEQIDL